MLKLMRCMSNISKNNNITKIITSHNEKNVNINRISIYEPSIDKLIDLIERKKYDNAIKFVKMYGVNVNGHTKGENTPLTNFAMKGDAESVEFLLNKLNANPYASCDCPYHKTAFHYASENGHIDVLRILQQYGNQINILDKRGYTPIDVAKNKETKEYLTNIGVITGKKLSKNKILLLSP